MATLPRPEAKDASAPLRRTTTLVKVRVWLRVWRLVSFGPSAGLTQRLANGCPPPVWTTHRNHHKQQRCTRHLGNKQLLQTKKVGFVGAMALIFNASTGPGLPFTPANFQSPGWLFTAIMFLVFMAISGFSVLFIIEAIQAIPGNIHFQGSIEYATLINFYFGPAAHVAGQFFLYGALQSNAVQNIVLASQAVDNLLIVLFGKTCGYALGGVSKGWMCVREPGSMPSPFGDTFMLFTLGFLVVLLLTIPLGIINLDDNIGIQIGAFVLSLLILTQWTSSGIINGLDVSRAPATVPLGLSYAQVVGTIMLNLAVTTIVPSWINLKSKDVNVQQAVWSSLALTTSIFIGSGVLLAMGFDIDSSNNILPAILSVGKPVFLAKTTVFLFAFVMLVPSIPVNLMISKNNLFQNKIASNVVASLMAFAVPWLVAIPLQTGMVLTTFQTWTSLIFVSTSNFIIPIIIYLRCHDFRRDYNANRILSPKQRQLLKSIHDSSMTIKKYIDAADKPKHTKRSRPRRKPTGTLVRSESPEDDYRQKDTFKGSDGQTGADAVALDDLDKVPSAKLEEGVRPSEATIAGDSNEATAFDSSAPTIMQPSPLALQSLESPRLGGMRNSKTLGRPSPASSMVRFTVRRPSGADNDALATSAASEPRRLRMHRPEDWAVDEDDDEDEEDGDDGDEDGEDDQGDHERISNSTDGEEGSDEARDGADDTPDYLKHDVPDPDREDIIMEARAAQLGLPARRPTIIPFFGSLGRAGRKPSVLSSTTETPPVPALPDYLDESDLVHGRTRTTSRTPKSSSAAGSPSFFRSLDRRPRPAIGVISHVGDLVSGASTASDTSSKRPTPAPTPVFSFTPPMSPGRQSNASGTPVAAPLVGLDAGKSAPDSHTSFSIDLSRDNAQHHDHLTVEPTTSLGFSSRNATLVGGRAADGHLAKLPTVVVPDIVSVSDGHARPPLRDASPTRSIGSASIGSNGSSDHGAGTGTGTGTGTPASTPGGLGRMRTLPSHPQFRSPAFRSVPYWFPLRGRDVAWIILVATTLVTCANIIIGCIPTS
ncbi:hypothetical protein BC831DRAFT_263070 [Entophlyctis helioformis]|nr:hypothetical protein BC831DRAFT_263070 [Entophlyctis helioformis]